MKLLEADLYLKLSKCKSKMQHISFVGFIVTPEGVEIKPDRVHIIMEWSELTCHRNVQVFHSCANFYRHFISSFSCHTKLMTDMLKGRKDGCFMRPFLPTRAIEQSFVELGNTFAKAPILAHFDPAKPVRLETDALGFAIAGIIVQQLDEVHGSVEGTMHGAKGKKSAGKSQWHHVTFWSRSMSPVERNYGVGNQEMLAIAMSCHHWCHYLERARRLVEILTVPHNP